MAVPRSPVLRLTSTNSNLTNYPIPFVEGKFVERLLDAGFYNFLVPFVESVDEARSAVAATRYPPQGVRGVSVSASGGTPTVNGFSKCRSMCSGKLILTSTR